MCCKLFVQFHFLCDELLAHGFNHQHRPSSSTHNAIHDDIITLRRMSMEMRPHPVVARRKSLCELSVPIDKKLIDNCTIEYISPHANAAADVVVVIIIGAFIRGGSGGRRSGDDFLIIIVSLNM